MGLFLKDKKEKQPQYYISETNMTTYNYNVYYLKRHEKILYFLLAFIVGVAVGYLFYGGVGSDAMGNPTTFTLVWNVTVPSIVGIVAGVLFLPVRTKQIQKKKQRELKLQFRELLDALSTSISSGKNVQDSFRSARDDLSVIYPEDASIIYELDVILDGMNNNVDIERSLMDFGLRSGIADIISFASVFETCYRKGGNIKDVIKNTQQIITEKMEVEQEIETIVAGSKNEQSIMAVMPIAIVGIIKMMSPEFAANFTSPAGLISTTIAVVMFVIAYFVGNLVLAIKI